RDARRDDRPLLHPRHRRLVPPLQRGGCRGRTVALPEWKPISSAIASTSIFGADPALWWRTLWWTHVVLLFSFLAYVPHSKPIHIIFAIVNTFFMDLTPKGALKTVDLEKSETSGVNRVEQLSWRGLLDGYACTECGRCTAACPANATGK